MSQEASHVWSEAELLSQVDWVRALARSLVRDESEAEDLTQSTLMAALGSPPARRGRRSPRGWLATVLRRQARDARVSRSRRGDRERDVARAEGGGEATDRVLLRAERQGQLVEELLCLPSAQREVLLLRYFEGLSPKRIAQRLGCPMETVRTRQVRGLASLRRRLADRHGPEHWQLALGPLLAWSGRPAARTGSLAGRWALVGSCVAVTGLALVAWSESPSPETPRAERGQATSTAHSEDPTPSLPDTAEPTIATRRNLDRPPEQAQRGAPLYDPTEVRGVLVDLQAQPVAGVDLTVWDFERSAPIHLRTDRQGRFGYTSGSIALSCADPARVLAGFEMNRPEPWKVEMTAVVAPARSLDIRIVDPQGEPLTGYRVRWNLSIGELPDFPRRLVPGSTPGEQSALTSGDDGWVSLEDIAWTPQTRISAEREGTYPRRVTTRSVSELDPASRTLTLTIPTPPASLTWAGRVIDSEGLPAERATVLAANYGRTETDEQGSFQLELLESRLPLEPAAEASFCVVAPGHQPKRYEALAAQLFRGAGNRGGLELTLGPPARCLRGRIVNERGEPLRRIEVHLLEGMQLAPGSRSFLEELAATDAPPSPLPVLARTDDEGIFECTGLCDRSYRLTLVDPRTFASTWTEPLVPGEGPFELTLPMDHLGGELRGTVVDTNGTPLAGVQVAIARALDPEGKSFSRGRAVPTRDDGAFLLEDVPNRNIWLEVGGARALSTRVYPEAGGWPEKRLTIEVTTLQRVRVSSSAEEPRAVRFLDQQGRKVGTWIPSGHTRIGADPLLVAEWTYEVAGSAQTLVELRRSEAGDDWIEVQRQPIDWMDGQVNEVHLGR